MVRRTSPVTTHAFIISPPPAMSTSRFLAIPLRAWRLSEAELVGLLSTDGRELRAWCVLPTHWHVLARITDLLDTIQAVGRLHGRASHAWNGEQGCRGRTCWHRCADRAMRNEAHVMRRLTTSTTIRCIMDTRHDGKSGLIQVPVRILMRLAIKKPPGAGKTTRCWTTVKDGMIRRSEIPPKGRVDLFNDDF